MPFCRCGELCLGEDKCRKCGHEFHGPTILIDRWQSRYLGSVIGLDSLSDSPTETTKPKKPSSFDFSLLDSRKVTHSKSMNLKQPECGACHKKLSGKTARLPDSPHKYHWHCLKCKGCDLPFEDPSFFVDPVKDIYHPNCAPMVHSCSRCAQPITDNYIALHTHTLHPRCFRCTACQKILHPTMIYTDMNGPYCQICTMEKLPQDKQVLSEHMKIVPQLHSKHQEMITSPIAPLSPLTQTTMVKPSTLMSSRGRPLPRFGVVRDCAGCHQRIVSVHEEIPGPKASKWHKKCLACHGCLKTLDSGAFVDEQEENGKLKPWCTTCLLTRKKRTSSLSQKLSTMKISSHVHS